MTNVVLGQRLLPNGKLRVHWQVDEENYPAKPLSSRSIDDKLGLIPVEEDWLQGDYRKFEVFTIPYYNYVYMKDMEFMDEAYIVQPFEHDLVVLDLSLNIENIQKAVTVGEGNKDEAVILFNKDNTESIVEDFQVVAGFDKKNSKPYDKDKIMEVDMAIGFKDIWKEDMGRIAEAYSYATLVTQNSIENAKKEGNTSVWGG